MSNNENGKNLGCTMSFPSTLTLVLIILKLTNVIDWSWWWVLAPLWVPLSLCFLLMVFLFFIGMLDD